MIRDSETEADSKKIIEIYIILRLLKFYKFKFKLCNKF